jgi:hypothetical protein
MVAHTCNTSYSGGRDQEDHSSRPVEIQRVIVQGQFGQKVRETPSELVSEVWWHTSVIPTVWEAYVGGLRSKANLRQKLEILSEK